MQFRMDVGGATVDTAEIKTLKLAKEVGALDQDLRKGDDARIQLVARVTDVKVKDVYDAHGNISETVKSFTLRVDELEILGVNQEAWRFSGDQGSEDDAVDDKAREDAARAEQERLDAGGELPGEQPAGETKPSGRDLAAVE